MRGDARLRRVFAIWCLLFFNTLTPIQGSILPIPHRVAQLLTQGSLAVALVLALTINPRLRIRPNWFLGLYTLLAVTSLAMCVRLVGLGTAYRSFRLIAFLAVLWLLTPWWGRRDLSVLRCQMRFLLIILATVVLGFFISPGKAMPGGRLSGVIWPIWSTQVAHFSAEVAGLTVVLWLSRLMTGRRALMLAVPTIAILVLTHTRTALLAMVVGLLVAGISLFLGPTTRSPDDRDRPDHRRGRRNPGGALPDALVGARENSQELTDLTGRTKAWSAALAAQRPTTNLIFGSGLSNDAVNGSPNTAENGLPIDSSWISIYQDQGIVGEVLVGAIFLLLLVLAFTRAAGRRGRWRST